MRRTSNSTSSAVPRFPLLVARRKRQAAPDGFVPAKYPPRRSGPTGLHSRSRIGGGVPTRLVQASRPARRLELRRRGLLPAGHIQAHHHGEASPRRATGVAIGSSAAEADSFFPPGEILIRVRQGPQQEQLMLGARCYRAKTGGGSSPGPSRLQEPVPRQARCVSDHSRSTGRGRSNARREGFGGRAKALTGTNWIKRHDGK